MKSKTVIGLLIMAAMILTFLPIAVLSDSGYSYIDEDGDSQTTGELVVTPITADTSELATGWYVVSSDVACKGTITVNGSVNLILADGCTLSVTGSNSKAGIGVSNGNSLTIYGQKAGTGTLVSQGGQYGAGIGGTLWELGGATSINGGTIRATGGQYGAGIGGGYNANAGTTTISGGTVTATGGQNSAGIGGSYHYVFGAEFGSGGTIVITGGNITANGNGYGAGIGGGQSGQSGIISISGGVVNATSGKVSGATGAAGIGGGVGRGANKITISGGTVVAAALDYGAGIGGGDRGAGGTIDISGGQITASSRFGGAGIGGGWGGDGGSTTINDGTITATSEYGGAGIGGGYLASSGTINIHGGHITAHGGAWGAGIGGGGGGSCNAITITDGIVHAIGDYNAGSSPGGAGIGSGGANAGGTQRGGTIKILGGKITAQSAYSSYSDYALDIGRGRNGINGTVLIDDEAIVSLESKGVDASVTAFGTCIIKGTGAGAQTGYYENGTRLASAVIDFEASTLSSGPGYSVSDNTVTLSGSGNTYALVGGTTNRSVTVASGSSANVILFAADIAPASGCAFNIAGATVNMRLMHDNVLSSGADFAGIQAPFGSTLNIYGSGSLTAIGDSNGAGIGGGCGMPGGSISITGGTVKAVGNGGGAGVGGGNDSDGGNVRIDGKSTALTAIGGLNGFDIGSGNRRINGGTLELNNNATVNLTRNGTDALKSYITGTVSGKGAEQDLDAGQYLDSYKLLTCTTITASPSSGGKAFEVIHLIAHVTGLSNTNPQGQIVFFNNGWEIGRASLNRVTGESDAMSVFRGWKPSGGTYMLTAKYVQNLGWDSYYMAEAESLSYEVMRIEQSALSINAVPDTVTYGDEPFNLLVSGGNGTGELSYAVTAGDAVTINASTGLVTVVKAGRATVTVTKAEDNNYNPKSASVNITVHKAVPPMVNYPCATSITYGQPLSDSALTGGSGSGNFMWQNPDTIPTVNNTGYTVVFTPNDVDNYDYSDVTLSKTVNITVNKATPKVVFPTAEEITYGQPLSDSVLTDGSGDGTFDWENPNTIPTVENDGYNVTFTPHDTDNYNTLTQVVEVSVCKADQVSLSIIEPFITYGDVPFHLLVSDGNGTGKLSYAVTAGEAVTIDADNGLVTVIKAGTATITVMKAGDNNYHAESASIDIIVNKATQIPLVVSGIPNHMVPGDAPFRLMVDGGSGGGALYYRVVSGTAVGVDENGLVHILNKGTALLSISKAEDDCYLATTTNVEIYVSKAPFASPAPSPISIETPSPTTTPIPSIAPSLVPTAPPTPAPTQTPIPPTNTAIPSPTPSPVPINTAVANPTPSPVPINTAVANPRDTAPPTTHSSVTDAPSSHDSYVLLKPLSIQVDNKTDKIALTISIDDLPDGTSAIKLLSGEYIQIDAKQKILELFISQNDINQDGKFVIAALNQENTPLGNYQLDISVDAWQNEIIDHNTHFDSMYIWIALGILVIGGAITTVYILQSKKKG